jgi:hypothetical protein
MNVTQGDNQSIVVRGGTYEHCGGQDQFKLDSQKIGVEHVFARRKGAMGLFVGIIGIARARIRLLRGDEFRRLERMPLGASARPFLDDGPHRPIMGQAINWRKRK